MPNTPRLTIGIPHLDRTELLRRTIESCLAQSVPAHVIVADQGHTEATAKLASEYPQVEWVYSKASCLQENWDTAARHCDTEFFAWCQDDDILHPSYAARIIRAFDAFPRALHWQACCKCSTHEKLGNWYLSNGPWLPMDYLTGSQAMVGGDILVPTSYLTSWALSPGVAFRCGQEFNEALEAMPNDCAIFTERLIVAEMGIRGPFVVDPFMAAYWMHHEKNESRNQWVDQPRQTTVLFEHLDRLMAQLPPTWKESLCAWSRMMPTQHVISWAKTFESIRYDARSDHWIVQIEEVLADSFKGRLMVAPVEVASKPRPWRIRLPRLSLPRFGSGPESLFDIAVRCGTDKERHHHYTPHYEAAFASLRDKPITLLEIGVGGYEKPNEGGESLRMWRDYFRRGKIYGIDSYEKSGLDGPRLKTFKGAQDDLPFLANVVLETGRPDIIIDDGSHEVAPTLATFSALWSVLRPGGWYVIEDTRTSYLPAYGGSRQREGDRVTVMGYFKAMIDDLNGADWIEPNEYQATVQSVQFLFNMIFIRKSLARQTAGRPQWVKV